MYGNKLRKFLIGLMLGLWGIGLCAELTEPINEALSLLKTRKDNAALSLFEKIITQEPDNLSALWGKAEVLRRNRDFTQSQELLNKILAKDPNYAPALISLAYIKSRDDKFKEAIVLINRALANSAAQTESRALAYMLLASINSKRSSKGWVINKIIYGTQIKGYFLKAKQLAPDLPEVHLGLGTFYLLAPAIAGGNLEQAIKELELAVKIAPDFATPYARLAQAYNKKGCEEKYYFFMQKTQELDPQNEVLKELTSK